ncbi:unnamed protein product [Closterium sp. Naga37s-1]|nr:unnamed protein product [Closterium sp. Naga37s-1]
MAVAMRLTYHAHVFLVPLHSSPSPSTFPTLHSHLALLIYPSPSFPNHQILANLMAVAVRLTDRWHVFPFCPSPLIHTIPLSLTHRSPAPSPPVSDTRESNGRGGACVSPTAGTCSWWCAWPSPSPSHPPYPTLPEPTTPPHTHPPPIPLDQILANLMAVAVRLTDRGHVLPSFPPYPPYPSPPPCSPHRQILANLMAVAVRLTDRGHVFLVLPSSSLSIPLHLSHPSLPPYPFNLPIPLFPPIQILANLMAVAILANLMAVAMRLTDRGHVFLVVRLAPDDDEMRRMADPNSPDDMEDPNSPDDMESALSGSPHRICAHRICAQRSAHRMRWAQVDRGYLCPPHLCSAPLLVFLVLRPAPGLDMR